MNYRSFEMRLLVYLRKSRSDVEEERKAAAEGREYDTLARHRRNLMDVIKREGHILVEPPYEELVSGDSIIERPEVQKMLNRMDEGDIDGVLVIDIDRLGRGDMYDSGILDRAFRYNNIKLITPTEIYDPEEENWELVFGVKSLVARQELKSINKRLQGGRRDKAKMGRSISKKPPYGYLRDENLKLYPDPDTAWVIQKIFEMTVKGNGRQAIAKKLDEWSVAPPDTNRNHWSPSTITAIVKNEVYIGKIIWGKITYLKRGGQYTRRKMKPEEWIVKDEAHEPLVTKELFDAANAAHSGRFRPSTKANNVLSNPLAGILKCELCGYTMLYQPRKDRPNSMIYCTKAQCRGKQKGAMLYLVENRILVSLEQYIKEFEIPKQQDAKNNSSIIQFQEKALDKKKKEIAEANKQKSALHDFLEKGVYDINTFMERQKVLVDRIEKLKDETRLIVEDMEKEKFREKNTKQFIPLVKSVLTAYRETDDIEKKNRLLKSVLERATFLRKKEWTKIDQFVIQLYPKI
ncbi:recombinase family protein [Bacillus sp. B-jedd]|uniref:recombinase family protein n=1 Tax=Bacillus sp. B-jedd TaxID=1476857 RepID=UPI0005157237|nr:recombinase family protein [Bacillus sp. B-jedd]CEG25963.1 site-specific recombinase [Bacillus sp. B-jedd]